MDYRIDCGNHECEKKIPVGRKYCSVRCSLVWRNQNDETLKVKSRERCVVRNKTPEQIEYSIRNINKVNVDPILCLRRDKQLEEFNNKPETKEAAKQRMIDLNNQQNNDPEFKARASVRSSLIMKKNWENPEFVEINRKLSKERWEQDWFIELIRKGIASKNNDPEFVQRRKESNSISGRRQLEELNAFKSNHNGRSYSEELLWQNSDFQILNPIWNFRVYNPGIGRNHQLDFAFLDIKLDLELDNSFEGLISHNTVYDNKRDYFLETQGWVVLRVRNEDLKDMENFLNRLTTFINNLRRL